MMRRRCRNVWRKWSKEVVSKFVHIVWLLDHQRIHEVCEDGSQLRMLLDVLVV